MNATEQAAVDAVRARTDPDPDGKQNAQSNIWTGKRQLKAAADEGEIPCERGEVAQLVAQLDGRGVLFTWHGLVTVSEKPYLQAVVASENMSDIPRRVLLNRVDRRLNGGDSE